MKDQDGTPTSSGYVLRSAKGQIVEGPSMDALSRFKIESYLPGIMVLHLEEGLALMENAPEGYSPMKNVDLSRLTKIASHSMQNRMRLLMRIAQILQVPLSTSPENNATCVENSQWQQELCESSGLMERKDLTLSQFKTRLWNQSRTARLDRKEKRESK